MFKLTLFIGALLFSEKLFSQSISTNDLIGVWTYVTDWDSFALTFKNDSILVKDTEHIRNQIYSYKLDSTQEGYLFKMKSNKSIYYETTPILIYRLKYFNDYFILYPYKKSIYNSKTGKWEERIDSINAQTKYILIRQYSK